MKRCVRCRSTFDTPEFTCPLCGWTPAVRDGVVWISGEVELRDADYRYDAIAEAEDRHFWFRSRAKLIASTIRRYFPRATAMLEVGCGTGGVLNEVRRHMPGLRLTGSEVTGEGLIRARRRLTGVELLQLDAADLPYDREFDVIGAFDVLEHVDDDARVLGEMYRSIRPGGGVVLTVPQHRWLWSAADDFAHHRRRYSRRGLAGRLEGAGFRCERITSFVSLLLPLVAISRLASRGHPYDPLGELRTGPMTNRALGLVMAGERALLGTGVSLPAGGSLLAVGRRVR